MHTEIQDRKTHKASLYLNFQYGGKTRHKQTGLFKKKNKQLCYFRFIFSLVAYFLFFPLLLFSSVQNYVNLSSRF